MRTVPGPPRPAPLGGGRPGEPHRLDLRIERGGVRGQQPGAQAHRPAHVCPLPRPGAGLRARLHGASGRAETGAQDSRHADRRRSRAPAGRAGGRGCACPARPGDPGILLFERVAGFGVGGPDAAAARSRSRIRPRLWKGRQGTRRAGGPQGVRGARVLCLGGAPAFRETRHRQPAFSKRARQGDIEEDAVGADQEIREARGHCAAGEAAPAAPFLRDASAERRRRPARNPGDARAREHRHHADLHGRHARTAALASTRASTRATGSDGRMFARRKFRLANGGELGCFRTFAVLRTPPPARRRPAGSPITTESNSIARRPSGRPVCRKIHRSS